MNSFQIFLILCFVKTDNLKVILAVFIVCSCMNTTLVLTPFAKINKLSFINLLRKTTSDDSVKKLKSRMIVLIEIKLKRNTIKNQFHLCIKEHCSLTVLPVNLPPKLKLTRRCRSLSFGKHIFLYCLKMCAICDLISMGGKRICWHWLTLFLLRTRKKFISKISRGLNQKMMISVTKTLKKASITVTTSTGTRTLETTTCHLKRWLLNS